MMRRIPLALLAAVLVSASPAAAQDQAAVTIADSAGPVTITVAEYNHWLDIVRAAAQNDAESPAQRQQGLSLLVSMRWVSGEARERGITVTDAEVQASFAETKRTSFPSEADYADFLRRSRRTEADVLLGVRQNLETDRITDSVVAPARASITDAVVDAYVRAHRAPLIPERRDIRLVVTKDAATALAAKHALERGQSWARVARRYSIDNVTKRDGGLLPDLTRDSIGAPLNGDIFRASRGELVGPVKMRSSHYVFTVVRVKPSKRVPAAAYGRQVRTRLISEAEDGALGAFVKGFNRKWRARTTCAPAFVWLKDCANAGK
jgi:foldase protein PrsA